MNKDIRKACLKEQQLYNKCANAYGWSKNEQNRNFFLPIGYEEIEALTVVDLVRGRESPLTSSLITEAGEVTGSHGITVKMDRTLAETDFSQLDMLVLPGGMPGTKGLEDCEALMEKLDEFYTSGKVDSRYLCGPQYFWTQRLSEGKEGNLLSGF